MNERSGTQNPVWERLMADHLAAFPDPGPGEPPPHRPKVAVLTCADARVSPSLIFDQPAGEVFIVRVAGNNISASALASLEFAVAELGVGLLVVMGHTSCGAVTAAAQGNTDEKLRPIVAPIATLAAEHPDVSPDKLSELNVHRVARELAATDGAIGKAAAEGRLDIVETIFDLSRNRVIELQPS